MKSFSLGSISAAAIAVSAFGAPALAAPAIERSSNLAQYDGLGSCRVINVAEVDAFEELREGEPIWDSLNRGTQVRLLEANISALGQVWHQVAVMVGANDEVFVYIPATSGAFDSSTLAYCSDTALRLGSISETCDAGVVDLPAGGELDLVSSPETGGYIINMYDGEPVTILDANVLASDGTLYHYIIDSAGNRGYVRAVVDGSGSVRCAFSVTW